jgi:hypothetical protein
MRFRCFRSLALGTMLSIAALSTPVLAADGDGMQSFRSEVTTMANKDGMITKKDFLAMMEKKFDATDSGKKGMLSASDIMRSSATRPASNRVDRVSAPRGSSRAATRERSRTKKRGSGSPLPISLRSRKS